MLAPDMRPALKTNMYYIPVPDGVYLRGNNNYLLLKGKSLYPLLEHLIPHLNGNVTLEELTRGLDTDRKRMVTHLIERLFTHQFLKDSSLGQPSTPLPHESAKYASNLAFIGSFQASAATRFEYFQNRRLLISGCEPGFISLIQICLRSGVKQISALVTPEGQIDSGSRQDILDVVASCDSSVQVVQLLDPLCWENLYEVRNCIQACDAVLHIAGQTMVARARLLNRLCVEAQKPFIQAVIVGDDAWIGPLVCAESEGCWECAWRRLQANQINLSAPLSYDTFHDQPQTPESRFLTPPKMTLLANQLIFELFKYFTQTSSAETQGHLSVLHLETNLSETHAFLPHPLCQTCKHPVAPTAARFLEQIQQLDQQKPIDRNAFLERFTDSMVDTRLGLFTAFGGDHFVQVPLAICRATLSDPMLQRKRPDLLTVTAAGRDTEDARWRVSQKACEYYAANLVDHRRLFPLEAGQHRCSLLSTDQLIGTRAFSNQQALWTWALDLQTQRVCPIPAEQVFPAYGQQVQGTVSAPGFASGMSWTEAICQALLGWCNYLTVENLPGAQRAFAQVDLTRVPLTSEGMYLYHLLQTAVGENIFVYDITGSLQVPTFATCLGEKVVAYTTHWDVARALDMGIEQALQQYQAEQHQQFEYAVAPVPDLPVSLRATRLSVPRYTLPDTWSARQAWLLQRLQVSGLRALAVPLDHDQALTRLLPFIVRVLLSRAELQRGE